MSRGEDPDGDSWWAFWLAMLVTMALVGLVGWWFVQLMDPGP